MELALVVLLVVGAVVYLIRRGMRAARTRDADCSCGCTPAPDRRR
jgi:hypothetical protein